MFLCSILGVLLDLPLVRHASLLNLRARSGDPRVVRLLIFLRTIVGGSHERGYDGEGRTASRLNHFLTSPLIASHSPSTSFANLPSTSTRASKTAALAPRAFAAHQMTARSESGSVSLEGTARREDAPGTSVATLAAAASRSALASFFCTVMMAAAASQ